MKGSSIDKVREFMFDDIDKTIRLAHTSRDAPNFLLALGLFFYTEYWGKLLLGIERKKQGGREHSKALFEAFLIRLDRSYYEGLLQTVDIYRKIRCGLAHAYMIDGNAKIDMGNIGCHGIEYNQTRDIFSGLEFLMNSRRLSIVIRMVRKEEQKAWITSRKL
jgi:hypothetical protein